jgi:uncharacterized protein with von Willebrand factor type A (vWA) domain
MLTTFLLALKDAGLPVSLREYLTLVEAMKSDLAETNIDTFHALARATLVKDERFFDRFDRVFAKVFAGLATPAVEGPEGEIPAEWLRRLIERTFSAEDKAAIAALGGFDKLIETLRERLARQKGRHQGGSKWIGTAGTSPFGAYGYNPEGVRIGQDGNRNFSAAKVWDRREFKDLSGDSELGVRAMKLALRRLRRFARSGAAEELDLPSTIDHTARQGHLDVVLRPERRNAVKVLGLFDVGGSMDWHVALVEELFSAARTEFKRFQPFYFHNCVYDSVWLENRRRDARTSLAQLLRTYGPDHRLILVGDASMSPYELTHAGGSVEDWNEEPGEVWLKRLLAAYPKAVWINPLPQERWEFGWSIRHIRTLMEDRMVPLTLDGIDRAMRLLR